MWFYFNEPEKLNTLSPVEAVRDSDVNSSDAPAKPHRELRLHLHDRKTNQQFLIDSGSAVSIVPANSYKSGRRKQDFTLYAANATQINTYVNVILNVNLNLRRSFSWSFIQITKPTGKRNLIKFEFVHRTLTRGTPVIEKARRLAGSKAAAAKSEIDYLFISGICRPSSSQSASPIHIVQKKNSSW